jgi:hypothetical protein
MTSGSPSSICRKPASVYFFSLEAFGQIPVAEVLVPRELDLPELELVLLLDLEVDAHRGLPERLDLEPDGSQVVSLGAIHALDAHPVLEQQRIVESGSGGECEPVADLLAIDVVVARDRDLPDDRILLHLEHHDPAVRSRLGEDPHVAEEAQRVHLGDVAAELRRVEARAGLRPDAGANRIALDAPVAPHLEDGDPVLHAEALAGDGGICEHEVEAHDHPRLAADRLRLRRDHRRIRAQRGEIGAHRERVVGLAAPRAKASLQLLLGTRGTHDLHRGDEGGSGARDLLGDAVGDLVDAAEQLLVLLCAVDLGMALETDRRRRDAHREVVAPGQLGEAAGDDVVGAKAPCHAAQRRVPGLARLRPRQPARGCRVEHPQLATGFEPRSQQVCQRFTQVVDGLAAVHDERQHAHRGSQRRGDAGVFALLLRGGRNGHPPRRQTQDPDRESRAQADAGDAGGAHGILRMAAR